MKILLTMLLATLLAGCAGMNGQFNCHRIDGKGVGCTSVETVNQLANRGAFNPSTDSKTQSLDRHEVALIRTPYATPNAGQPLRQPEVVQRVWIAPYQDKVGRYVGPTYVAIVVEPSHWIDFSPSVIQHSNEEEF